MCLIQFCVVTPHFYSFFSKQLLQLPLVAEQSQEKNNYKNSGVFTSTWGIKPNNENPKI